MMHGGAGLSVEELPLSVSWRALMLDAVILAAACVAGGRMQVHPASKMCLLREVQLCGLSQPGRDADKPTVDIMAKFEVYLRLAGDPVRVRRSLARHMDPFVGTPWAATVLRIAETIAQAPNPLVPPSDRATATLRTLRLSLGLCYPNDCSPPP